MLENLMAGMETLGLLMAGLLVRLGLALAMLAAIAVPVAVAVLAWTGIERLTRRLRGLTSLDGMPFRSGTHHASGHTWLRALSGGDVRVGLDGLVPRLLGVVESVTLPPVGTQLRAGEALARVAVGGRATTLRSPVDGRISRVNRAVRVQPALLREDPYGRGWLCAVETRDGLSRFPRDAAAKSWLRSERRRLESLLEAELGMAAADGGELVQPDAEALSDAAWQRLARALLDA